MYDSVKDYATELPADWLFNLHTLIRIPSGVSVDELRKVEIETKERLAKKFKEMYSCEVQDNKMCIRDSCNNVAIVVSAYSNRTITVDSCRIVYSKHISFTITE